MSSLARFCLSIAILFGLLSSVYAGAIHTAASSGQTKTVMRLIEQDPKLLNEPNQADGYTPLHYAVANNQKEVVRYLLEKGAGVNPVSQHKYTPLHLAAMNGNEEIVDLLLAKNPRLNLKDNSQYTALMYALNHNQGETFKKLIKHGASIDTLDGAKRTLLHYACMNGRLEAVK
ncbi:MAG TPA: ankyrin repeat domain-containing protein, partial [Pirellulales bacterium]|nr:ankyrin repeat domain-containing protein [Pirellulales bacterium]